MPFSFASVSFRLSVQTIFAHVYVPICNIILFAVVLDLCVEFHTYDQSLYVHTEHLSFLVIIDYGHCNYHIF